MKLLFLYLEDYKMFKNAQLNFDISKQFHYCEGTKELHETGGNEPPLGFYYCNTIGDNKCPCEVVDSISALVGDNASGKTSLASFFTDFCVEEQQYHFILVFSLNECLFIETTIAGLKCKVSAPEENLQVITHDKLDRLHEAIENDQLNYFDRFKFVYNSYIFNTSSAILANSDNAINMSTTALMKDSWANSKNKNSSLTAYIKSELIRNVLFCLQVKKHEVQFSLPLPTGFYIGLNISYAPEARSNLSTVDSVLKNVRALYKDIRSFLCPNYKFNQWDTLDSRHFCFAVLGDAIRFAVQNDGDHLFCILSEFWNLLKEKENYADFKSYNYCSELRRNTYCGEIHNQFNVTLNETLNAAAQIWTVIEHMQDKGKPIWNLNNSERDILYILEIYYGKAQILNRYLTFGFDPILSSGEYAQLSIYSRLWWLMETPIRNHDKSLRIERNATNAEQECRRNVIMFFDEIETTMHPKLQVALIKNMVAFFETMYRGYKVHLIFATHSPFILSDIFQQNIIQLVRDNKEAEVTIEHQSIKTIGSNIHTILKQEFCLGNAIMSEFSQEFIRTLSSEIDALPKKNDDYEKCYKRLKTQIDFIADDLIRNLLLKKMIHSDEKKYGSPNRKMETIAALKRRIAELERA